MRCDKKFTQLKLPDNQKSAKEVLLLQSNENASTDSSKIFFTSVGLLSIIYVKFSMTDYFVKYYSTKADGKLLHKHNIGSHNISICVYS